MSLEAGQVIVCVVPPHLADELVDPLREFYAHDPRVVVIAERRLRQRRASRDDLTTAAGRAERRGGGDRRRPVLPRSFTPPPSLPGVDQVSFVQRLVPVGDGLGGESDDAVIERARAGDPSAPAELYWRFYERVHSRLTVLLGNSPEVHDAVAPAFGRLLDALEDAGLDDTPFEEVLYAAVEASVADRLPDVPDEPSFVADLGPTLEITDETLEEPVTVAERDPRWFHRGIGERDRLLRHLRELDISVEHIGSTAIPSIAARAIVDLAIAIPDRRIEGEVRAVLRDLGYEDCGTAGTPGRAYLRRRGLGRYDVHVVHAEGGLWRDALALREFLRRHPAEAHRWANVKREAARSAGASSLRYFELRREALADLTLRARAAGSGRPRSRAPVP